MAKKKEVEVIDMGGAKTVAKKKSFVTRVKVAFAIFSVIWISFVVWYPLHIRDKYATSIKQSTVVAIFYDLQRNIADQYDKMLQGIKKSINLEKPIGQVIDKVKMAETQVDKVTDTTAKASDATGKAKDTTSGVRTLGNLAGKFGVKTSGVDKAMDKVDNTAQLVNQKLNSVEAELTKVAKAEVDKVIDEAIKKNVDPAVGMLLTKYDMKHVYPWNPSSWPTARAIYAELVKSDLGFVQTIIKTVNKYFTYVMWAYLIVGWGIGLYIWLTVRKYVKGLVAPFIVCPRCGHTFADKRTMVSLLKVLQPWKWF